MTYFLIEHDRRSKQSRVTSFDDRESSIRALNTKEAARDDDTDVVLLIAESEANIRITHPRYFWDDARSPLAREADHGLAKYVDELRELMDDRPAS